MCTTSKWRGKLETKTATKQENHEQEMTVEKFGFVQVDRKSSRTINVDDQGKWYD